MITLITVFDTGFQAVSTNVPSHAETVRIMSQTHSSNVKHFLVTDTRYSVTKVHVYEPNTELRETFEVRKA